LATYDTERGEKLDALRNAVNVVVDEFPEYWKGGPMKHLLYAAVIRGIIDGHVPVPPEE
jgi:hypothetical protein